MIHLYISTAHCFNFNILKLINILLFDFCVLRIIQKRISLHKAINIYFYTNIFNLFVQTLVNELK